ncbi:MAG: redox-regulated ATPase YchF [Candidatus Altiarchaeales archaeon]|nr:redox-regulated ATPase YchF [Candidatus Altiarchaeales archaeon]
MELGVVGKPNVGKSTFYRAATLAQAEVASFPFTTIKPNLGVGYVSSPCPCAKFDLKCSPRNSLCRRGLRFTPVKIVDVAGIVPGAHRGRGLGNQFLDDLRQAHVLIHVIDVSGKTDENGEPTKNHDPLRDASFLSEEIDLWFAAIIKRNLDKIRNKVRQKTGSLAALLSEQLSGLGVSEDSVKASLKKLGVEGACDLTDQQIRKFASLIRSENKPIIVAANKIDLDEGNFKRLKQDVDAVAVCAEAELALREANQANLIEYVPGTSHFKLLDGLSDKQKEALDFVEKEVLDKHQSTGVQKILNKAVFQLLGYVTVYPVENEHKLCDSSGAVLPDSYLMPPNSTVLDLAYKIHTSIGENFGGAIDVASKKKVGKDHTLSEGDVIKIISAK